jgi:hypothetical protein
MSQNYIDLAKKLLKINAVEDMFPAKENYNLLDIIEYSSPSGDGFVLCIIESVENQYALQVYNGTNDQGFLPLLSNQQVDQNGYYYRVNGQLNLIKNDQFDLVGIDEKKDSLDVFLSAKVDKESEEYLWYGKQEFLDVIESQLSEYEDFDFDLIKNYIERKNS